ncbi:endonuclease/exonuclease/phosphatase family protein [Miniphocaeibacter halophilus]|uniref:Endonuclease/exonuclease/phosphatase family protein n=1 Tax=Miniphocaeibacter halophilus TaxID=2931922 RepID=A0AC61MSA1_9FIRM|nr:endonuclease/exonuclease/phosphatase family protein [Miniphocaeibacter halophilus]QQK07291.1 endonuclease/exonuclease/phosphatase family protein [Miniphocaeibacter halophilus]
MKILTLNTHSWLEKNQKEKFNIFIDNILEEKYDIIFLQEINQSISAKEIERKDEEIVELATVKEDNFGLLLKDELERKGLNYYYTWDSTHIGYDIYDEGIAILSLNPILEVKSKIISSSLEYKSPKTRKATGIKIKYKDKNIWAFTLHFSWWKDGSFQYEWEKLREIIKEIDADLFILAGDFNNNANIRNEGYDLILKSGFYDSFNLAKEKIGEYTVESEIDGWACDTSNKRIDFIFLSEEVVVKKYEVVFKNKLQISDHFGVKVELEI